jgi:nicotinate-nucleotide pyrophosphorylase (carboxylating)
MKNKLLSLGGEPNLMFVPQKILEEKLTKLLEEDVGLGDVTSSLVIPDDVQAKAVVLAKEAGIVAGIEEVSILAKSVGLTVHAEVADGEEIKKGQVLLKIAGDARLILSAERTMLNLLSRMSGIATKTRKLVAIISKLNSSARIASTRKTAPGLLYFDKKAVIIGGGDPHRLHLDDMILIKDNHIAVAGSAEAAVKKAKAMASFSKKIEVEISDAADVLKVVAAGADVVMLDNFTPSQIKQACGLLKKAGCSDKVLLEASGGVTEENIKDYAKTSVNIISIGALTHSPKALDISLEITKTREKKRS